jgi:hypothetical protein
MSHLVIAIFSIVLMAAAAALAVSNIPLEALQTYQATKAMQQGFARGEPMVSRYLQSQRDGSGNIVVPAPGVDIAPAAVPTYGYMPAVIPGFQWFAVSGLYNGLPGVGLCLLPTGAVSDAQKKAIDATFVSLPQGGAVRGSSCNESVDSSTGTALTYWVLASQLN